MAMIPTGHVTYRMLFAVAASFALHALVLLHAGRLEWGQAGRDRAFGDSASGNVLRARFLVRTEAPEPAGSQAQAPEFEAETVVAPTTDAPAPHITPLARGPETSATPPAPLVNHGEPSPAALPSWDAETTRLGVPALPLVRYYTSKELDVRPAIRVNVMPEYPASALAARANGKVAIEVLINEHGDVDQVNVLKATPADYFEEAAITAWRKAKFTPGMIGNARVKSRLAFEVNFEANLADASTANNARHRY
jgi:TonB family protein